MEPKPPQGERLPIWVGGKSTPALRRAAANDGWLGLPATVEDNLAIVSGMQAMRQEMGLPLDTFRPCVSLIEPLTRDAATRLSEGGIGDTVAIPWFPTPWEMEAFVPEGADISQLAVKKDAISRYAERVIAQHT